MKNKHKSVDFHLNFRFYSLLHKTFLMLKIRKKKLIKNTTIQQGL